MRILLFALPLLLNIVYAQSKDPEVLLERVKKNFNRIEDYKVDVKIHVDVDFIKVPDMQAKLFFEQPDKLHLDSEGFAMLPKSGMNFSPTAMLDGDYTSFYVKDTLLDGSNTSVVKVIPLGDKGDLVLSTLWIDTNKDRIRKVESTTKTQGTYVIDLKYDNGTEYPLPSKMIFSFNVEKMNLPKGMGGDINTESKQKNSDKTTTGKVTIAYTGYQVNKGIPAEIFEQDKKEEK